MPVMNGYEACRQIHQMIRDKEIPALKIVAVTADVTRMNILRCKEAGFDETLSKPIINEELKRVFTLEKELLIVTIITNTLEP